jgi:hypothetical protein
MQFDQEMQTPENRAADHMQYSTLVTVTVCPQPVHA